MSIKKTRQLEIQDALVAVATVNNEDYICLTDMLKQKDGEFFITDWLRNRNTLEFLSVWEEMHNPDFNYGEFAAIKSNAGLNSFKISVKEWVNTTHAIGIVAKAGRYGGTYAHKDIAFEFGSWISPTFKLYLIKEYQRLKEIESNQYNLEWDVRRILSKTNYHIHTDAIKNYIIPQSSLPKSKEGIAYAGEADVLNLALFGCTAKEWREANPDLSGNIKNVRDIASINQLAVLSNLESMNAEMIREGMNKAERYRSLRDIAKRQLSVLDDKDFIKALPKTSDSAYLTSLQEDEKK